VNEKKAEKREKRGKRVRGLTTTDGASAQVVVGRAGSKAHGKREGSGANCFLLLKRELNEDEGM
jgi:hypothetical protein